MSTCAVMCFQRTRQGEALGVILVPVTVEIQEAALAVGEFAAHLLIPYRTLLEVLHILQKRREEKKGGFWKKAN